jgi:hypothetical protein
MALVEKLILSSLFAQEILNYDSITKIAKSSWAEDMIVTETCNGY